MVLIKAVIFDVGGVLVRTTDWSLRKQWEEKLRLNSGQLDELVFGDPMGTRAQRGEISTEELWNFIGQSLNLSTAELSTLQTDYWANDFLDLELVGLLDLLRGSYKLALLSNAMDNLRELLSGKYPIASYFDLIVSSAEEGIMKPNKEIYIRTVGRLSVQPKEALFIDDSKENVLGAEKVGLRAILFHPDLDIKAELAKRGVLTGEENE